ncbi:MAG: hypothetical protein N3B14_00770 [Thermoleophilia bacterium]|nr:hypothetical protein [Thermoleophilia bacterium]
MKNRQPLCQPARAAARRRAVASVGFLVTTTLSGLLAHGQVPHGTLERSFAPSAWAPALETLHVVSAACLALTVVWHLADKCRTLIGFARVRTAKSLRHLLASAVLWALLMASLATGLVGSGPSQIPHHVAVAAVLTVAGVWHGGRRLARGRRASRQVPVGARS